MGPGALEEEKGTMMEGKMLPNDEKDRFFMAAIRATEEATWRGSMTTRYLRCRTPDCAMP